MIKQLRTKVLMKAAIACTCSLFLASCASAQQKPINIALGKTVTFNKAPNYSYSTDPGDKVQLTDGKYSSEGKLDKKANTTSIWVQKGTVGWSRVMPVVITIDLGKVQPISGVSYSTAAGRAGVAWPSGIYIATSTDNKTWHFAGDLTSLSRKNGLPPKSGYAPFRYITHDLHTKGRYIRFGVVQQPYAFVDEIEVYKGDDADLNVPQQGRVISNMETLVKKTIVTSKTKRRLSDDIRHVSDALNESKMPATQKSTYTGQLASYQKVVDALQGVPATIKTILPLNDTNRDTLAIYGEVLKAQGYKPLTVWKKQRYAWTSLLATPTLDAKPGINIAMLGNQHRSDSLLLTNASGNAESVNLHLQNAPAAAQPGWLTVYSVAWTDTSPGTPVADALMPVTVQNGQYKVDIPAGMTRKVWFTVDSSKVPAGSYKSTFAVSGLGQASVPFALRVSSVKMNKPEFSMGMWDYTNGSGSRGITPENKKAAIALMRSHYVDTPWAVRNVLPWPKADDFDDNGNLKNKLDFSNLDKWIGDWQGARSYFVFASVGHTFANAEMGTPTFVSRLSSWSKALAAHMQSKGLKPAQLGLLLVDEPHSDEQDAIIAAWAKVIKVATPQLTLFQDPTWARPDQTKIQAAITLADVICPPRPRVIAGGKPVIQYYENLQKQGKEIWLYNTTGPARTLNPQTYYRGQAWEVFKIGGRGQGFWAFGDTGGATSWNAYAVSGIAYAPAFLGKDSVTDSVHWDAVREGVEDFEELTMLKSAIEKSQNAAWKSEAQKVLDIAVDTVTGAWNQDYDWQNKYDPTLADAQLAKVRNMLEQNKK